MKSVNQHQHRASLRRLHHLLKLLILSFVVFVVFF